ncbi:MAG: hypothetical protein HN613_06170 [Gammaproteobacteria bacterium]|jgi:hypothetical protein|nr:hypothetical protein [Gammaproteobacteria bacterium]MBT7604038.1 hypothetical protein [Gammaproteobacteria bacterium]
MQTDNPKNEKIFSIHLNSNKAENFNRFTTSFFKKISNINFLEIIVHIDKDDNAMKEEIDKLNKKYNNSIKFIETDIIKNFNDSWKPINLLLKKTSKSALYVAVLSDDITIKTNNWDSALIKHSLLYDNDKIFRVRCSQYKYHIYNDLWECGYKPDFSFYSKKWLDVVGYWNPCIGPDTFQETVSYYLSMYGKDFKRSIVDDLLIFSGEETLTNLNMKQRIKRTKLGYKSFCELISYKIQKKSFESAYLLAKEINKDKKIEIEIIKVNYISHTFKNFIKKLKYFHHRGSEGWLTSSLLFNIFFIFWCKIDFFDKYFIFIIIYLEKKNILKKFISNKEQYSKLKEAIKHNE